MKLTPEQQSVVNSVDNTLITIRFNSAQDIVRFCYTLAPVKELLDPGTRINPSDEYKFIKALQTAIEGQAAELKLWKDNIANLEKSISTSNQHIASNEKQLYDQGQDMLTRMEGTKQDIANLKTHLGNSASIMDDLKNQVDANSKEATMLRALLKDHSATKHNGPDPKVVYGWDVQPYELGIRTKTSVPSAGHSYEYKYTMNGVETSIVSSDANLKIGTELGTLTYTPLNKDVSKIIIEQTS